MLSRVFLVRLLLAAIIVIPVTYVFQRTLTNAAETRTLMKNQAIMAQERVDRVMDACLAFNDQRGNLIATSEAVIRAAAEAPPSMISDRDRLLLTQFVIRANRAAEAATHPKTCTVKALHLEPFVAIAGS